VLIMSKVIWNAYIFIFSALFFFTTQTNASVYDSSSNFLENKKSCLASPRLCLNQVDENIGNIKKVNGVSFDADRYAEIIILYNQLNQYENALKFITWINKRIARMGNYSVEAKNYTQLRLIETLQKNGQYKQAKLLLKGVNPREVGKSTITLISAIKAH